MRKDSFHSVSISQEEAKALHVEAHSRGMFPGDIILQPSILPGVVDMVKRHNPKSLLDYGCGKGKQYTDNQIHKQWGGLMPTLYDPGLERYSTMPEGAFDGVICTAVFEHVPLGLLHEEMERVFRFAEKFLFIVVGVNNAVNKLANGENAHFIIMSPDWWDKKIEGFRVAAGFEGELITEYL